jgi:hypothetical protein
MKQLEAHDPLLSAAILRNVLRMSNLVRNRLEREVTAIDAGMHSAMSRDDSTWSEHAVSKTLGSRVLAEIRDMHQHHLANMNDLDNDDNDHFSRVTGAGAHHAHHFHHVSGVVGLPPTGGPLSPRLSPRLSPTLSPRLSPRLSPTLSPRLSPSVSPTVSPTVSPRREPFKSAKVGERSPRSSPTSRRRSDAPEWTTIRPHLSAAHRQDAIECFLFHSVLDETHHSTKGVWEKLNGATGDVHGQRKRSGSSAAFEIIAASSNKKRRPSTVVDSTTPSSSSSSIQSSSSTHTQLVQPLMIPGTPTAAAKGGKYSNNQEDPLASVEERRISLEELQRAVMDLGLFPTAEEILQMHEKLGKNAKDRELLLLLLLTALLLLTVLTYWYHLYS